MKMDELKKVEEEVLRIKNEFPDTEIYQHRICIGVNEFNKLKEELDALPVKLFTYTQRVITPATMEILIDGVTVIISEEENIKGE